MSKRFFGFDVHKYHIFAAAVDRDQNVVFKPRKIHVADFEDWAIKNLSQSDEAVIEAMTGTWITYDLLAKHAGRVVVAHPYHVKLIAASFVKTDKRDALALARLLAANIVPEVWVPPQHVRELRSLIYHRNILVRKRAAAKNRVRGILQRYRIIGPAGMAVFDPAYWEEVKVPPIEKLRAQHALEDIEMLTRQISETEEALTRASIAEPWVDDVPFLVQLPGIQLITAMTILSAIGEIGRFPTAKKLVGYAGLGARVYSSGLTYRTGGITKQGRRELRGTMIEAAWNAIKYSPEWRARHEHLAKTTGSRQKAAVAIARKLLVTIWHILSKREVDRNANHNTVGKSMLIWGWKHGLAVSQGLKPAEFAAQQLDKLGIQLEKIQYCSRVYHLQT